MSEDRDAAGERREHPPIPGEQRRDGSHGDVGQRGNEERARPREAIQRTGRDLADPDVAQIYASRALRHEVRERKAAEHEPEHENPGLGHRVILPAAAGTVGSAVALLLRAHRVTDLGEQFDLSGLRR